MLIFLLLFVTANWEVVLSTYEDEEDKGEWTRDNFAAAFELRKTDRIEFLVDITNREGSHMLSKPPHQWNEAKGIWEPVEVLIRLQIESISKLSEVNMDMEMTFLLEQYWTDSRLAMNNSLLGDELTGRFV